MTTRPSFSRRAVLRGGAVAGVTGGASLTTSGRADAAGHGESAGTAGRLQPGIVTPAQDHLALASFDLTSPHMLARLPSVLRMWRGDIANLQRGLAPLADTEPELALDPGELTVTVGLGHSLFSHPALEPHRPAGLVEIPPYDIDDLQPLYTGGDIIVQACSNNPVATSHAVRVLAAAAASVLTPRGVQWGYRSSHAAGPPHRTGGARNAFGQVDGMVQPDTDTEPGRAAVVITSAQWPQWARGGTTMAVRRIAMHTASWSRLPRGVREEAIGRDLAHGAPLTGGTASDAPDFAARDAAGGLVIHGHAHARIAHSPDESLRMLRRGYTFEEAGALLDDATMGLVFIAFQADLQRQFIEVQNRLALKDLLNQWTTPRGSITAVVPPLPPPDTPYAQQLWKTAGLL